MVQVLSKSGKPLMQCENVVARLLLKQGKARVKHTLPFTIKLNYETTEYVQWLLLAVDTGSTFIGTAVGNEKNEIIYMAKTEIRNDVTNNMKARSKYRRNRRNRKTRYRKARWLNRKNSIKNDRFSPTMISKINAHMREITLVCSILPISEVKIETGNFDPHALKNPEVLKDKSLYQHGLNYGFANSRAFVLDRDGYKCQNKGCKNKNKTLHAHHIIYKRDGGSDEPSNLITLCVCCHDAVHDNSIKLNIKGKKKGQLKHATQMNSIRIQLLKLLPEAKQTFGFITKEHRQLIGLPKEHYFDAVAIISGVNPVTFKVKDVLIKKCVAKGDYQLTKGSRGETKLLVGKFEGFRKFDKVKYKGVECFVKGKMSTGYMILMDINGKNIEFKPMAKYTTTKRISARKSILVISKKMEEVA